MDAITERTQETRLAPPARLRSRVTLAGGAHEEITVRAPSTGEVLAAVPAGTEADVELAVGRGLFP